MFDCRPRPLFRGFLLWIVFVAALPLRAAEPATGFVPVPGGKLYYEAQGEGPPLVLLHDGLVHSATWDGQLAVFAQSFRTIRYDRRGYGRSETTSRDFSAVADLLALLDALQVDRAAVLGCSSGGGLALDFTLAHPERVRALVLEGAVLGGLELLRADRQERYVKAMEPIDTVRYLPHAARTPVLFQFARRDEYISPWDAALYLQATPGPKEVEWYDTAHQFNADAREHRDAWLARSLGLAGVTPAAAGLFELRSGFWINLHHFLFAEAHRRGELVPAAGGPLSEGDRKAWDRGLDFYRRELADRDLLFDERMVRIKNALAAAGSAPDLGKVDLSPDLQAALEAAAPVYRAHWWPRHDADNRAWIAAVEPRLARSGPALAARLARAYGKEWPFLPIPVDVVFGSLRFGAYTTNHPTHITLSSPDPRGLGEAGLESLFHEASHGWDQILIDAVSKAAADLGRPVPENLWHALLFYTVGDAIRKALAEAGIAGYIPVAVKEGVYDRGWKEYRKAMEKHWQPYLDGKTDFTSAVRAVVAALPPGKG